MSMKAGGNRSKPGGGNTAGAAASGAGGSGGGRPNLGRSVKLKRQRSDIKTQPLVLTLPAFSTWTQSFSTVAVLRDDIPVKWSKSSAGSWTVCGPCDVLVT